MIFCDKFMCIDPLNIVFLCGPEFRKKNVRDKRKILKAYCESSIPNCRAIILEENFQFGTSGDEFFSYNDIFLNSLSKVEQLVALFTNRIIVIHESISTAAEIGMFAIDPNLAKKMCVLLPDEHSIDENKLSGFISLAFFNKFDTSSSIKDRIVFYPDVVINKKSNEISSYYTYFHDDAIGPNLGRKITSFIGLNDEEKLIRFIKKRRGMYTNDSSTVNFWEDEEEQKIRVFVHAEVLKLHLLSLLTSKKIKNMLREEHTISEHVTNLENEYHETLLRTVAWKEGRDYRSYSVDVTVKDSGCKAREAIGMFLFLLQAARIVHIERKDGKNVIITSTRDLKQVTDKVSGYLKEEKPTVFRGLDI